jgi:uncharacterized GH25 family protein
MRSLLVLAALSFAPLDANGHYHMLLPDKSSVKVDEQVSIAYQFGHPFEAELFDAEKPKFAKAYAPDLTSTDLTDSFEKVVVDSTDKKKIVTYRCKYTPKVRGDHVILVQSPPIYLEDQKLFIQDTVRVTLHVQSEKGWNYSYSDKLPFVFVPMTRPYGLRAGTVFQAKTTFGVHRVEVEKYNAVPPRELPPEEFVTSSLMTDDRGVATCTLPETGWWVLTAEDGGRAMELPPTIERDGKKVRLIRRASLWVNVEGYPSKKGE